MKSKTIYTILVVLFLGCKCQFEKGLDPLSYQSIKESKANRAFINEFIPESPYLKIGRNDYTIDEAWVERSHLRENFHDDFTNDRCLVVKFLNKSDFTVDLHSYVKEDGNGPIKIWRNLSTKEYIQDTLVIYYRQDLDSFKKNKKDKTFLFYKK